MMKLIDAVAHRFPQQNEWATRALASLTDVLNDDTPIHELVEGWCRVGDEGSGQLIDVLFVLTDTRLGIGHASDLQLERWIDLDTIVVVDAIDNSLYPLQTVELQFSEGDPLTLGWPHPFSDRFVSVLVRRRDAGSATGDNTTGQHATSDAELEHAVVGEAAIDMAAIGGRDPKLTDEQAAKIDKASETFFGDLEPEGAEPVVMPSFADDDRAPWELMGDAWPANIDGVNYLGGHPSVKRKRKGGVMSFGPEGLRVHSAGVGRWEITVDWPHTASVDVQGPDEIMFAEALRVPSSSCVVVVTTEEGSRLFFEVTDRRPPSVRSEIAAVISMVVAARTSRPATIPTPD